MSDHSVYRERLESSFFGPHPVVVSVNGSKASLVNVSMGGCLVEVPSAVVEAEPGMELALDVELGGVTGYRGVARVVRSLAANMTGLQRLALEVVRGFIDLPALQDRHGRMVLEEKVKSYNAARAKIPTAYRATIEAIADFQRYYQSVFAAREKVLLEEGARAEEALAELTEYAFASMYPTWLELRSAAADASRPHLGDVETLTAMRRLTERLVTFDLLGAPLLERSYRKPLGYAGDYRTMMFIYNNCYEGSTVNDRVWHRFMTLEGLSEGVRRRKELMKDLTRREHARVVAERGASATTRVMSLGCGPALEVFELAREDRWTGSIHWTLIDQETRALSTAYKDVFPTLRGTEQRGEIECLNLSLRRVLKENVLPDEPLDFFYAAGLFDYLKQDVARRLISLIASKLNPGGMMAIGNARVDDYVFYAAELMLDWSLLYRTESDMYGLASHLGDGFDTELVLEPAGVYWFLKIRKRPA